MLAQSLLLALFATSALASPTPELHELLPVRFSPAERAIDTLGNALQGRQTGGLCPSGYKECGADGCVPLDGSTCCGSDGSYCEPGLRCTTGGCCPTGQICTGQAGTRTVTGPDEEMTSARTSAGSAATGVLDDTPPPSGTGSSGTGSSGTGSSGTGSSGTGSSGTGSSGTGSSGTGSSGTGNSGTGSSGTGSGTGSNGAAAGGGGASAANPPTVTETVRVGSGALPVAAANVVGAVLAVVLAASA